MSEVVFMRQVVVCRGGKCYDLTRDLFEDDDDLISQIESDLWKGVVS